MNLQKILKSKSPIADKMNIQFELKERDFHNIWKKSLFDKKRRNRIKPKKGMFVALHNIFPVENKYGLGIIVEITNDPLGFNYGVFEFGDNKLFHHHISTIIPLKTKCKF